MSTQTHAISVKGSSSGSSRSTVTKTANTEIGIGSTVDTASSEVLSIVLDVSNVVAWWLLSTRDVTFTVNDDGSPDETYVLKGGVMMLWNSSLPIVNPMTHDWTSVKIANASGDTAQVTGGFLVNT